jgi:protein phosphatase
VTQHQAPDVSPAIGDSQEDASANGGEIRVKLFARTDVGQIREHNEDNFLVADLSRKTRGLLEGNRAGIVGPYGSLFAVCDGMGGAAAGEIASQLAVDILFERMADGIEENRRLTRDQLARRLVHAIEAAGLRIFHEAKLDRTRRGMGTTVTAAALVDDHLFFAQVGDSRGYVLRQGQLVQLTRDQSLVNQLIEAGQLTEEEAETFEHNNIILQALGTADTVQVDLTYCELRRGDTLLLCSDGLSGMVRFEDIREVLCSTGEPIDACKLLTERANQAGGHDNITVVVVQFDGMGLKPASADGEPLKYRKYPLPEDPSEHSEPTRRITPEASVIAGPTGDPNSGSGAPQGLASTFVFSPPPNIIQSLRPGPMAIAKSLRPPKHAPGAEPAAVSAGSEESIHIPGTHVPPWVVFIIVVAVILILAGTAFLLLN